MDYVVLILTLLAGATAIIGDTWNKKKKGIKKLTITGWITTSIVILGFLVSFKSTYDKNNERKIAQTMAANEIDRHLKSLVHPFSILLWDINNQSYDYSIGTIDLLLNQQNIDKIGDIDIRKKAPHYQGVFYILISKFHNDGREGLDRVMRFYGNVIDSDVRILIQGLTNNFYYDSLVDLERYKPTERDLNEENEFYPMPFRNIAGTGVGDDTWKFYKEHIQTIRKIKLLNDKLISDN